jgi:hypothetical protein
LAVEAEVALVEEVAALVVLELLRDSLLLPELLTPLL